MNYNVNNMEEGDMFLSKSKGHLYIIVKDEVTERMIVTCHSKNVSAVWLQVDSKTRILQVLATEGEYIGNIMNVFPITLP